MVTVEDVALVVGFTVPLKACSSFSVSHTVAYTFGLYLLGCLVYIPCLSTPSDFVTFQPPDNYNDLLQAPSLVRSIYESLIR